MLLFLALAALLCGYAEAKDKKNTIYVAGFFPTSYQKPVGSVGRGVLPAVRLALKHINSNPYILKGHHLDIMWNNTQCDSAVGMKAFFDMIHNPPHKVMLFGAACTQVTDPMAKTSKFWHITQLSYADTHPMFSSKKYPNFFRIVPSETDFNAPRLHLLRRFNWTRVGTIYQNQPRYALAHNKLLADLDENGIAIADTESLDNNQSKLSRLKEKDVWIILGNFDESWARKVFCEAYQLGMYGRKYQWIIVGTYEDYWWTVVDNMVPCTDQEILTAIEGMLFTDLLTLRTNNKTTVSGLTAEQYKEKYDVMRGKQYSTFHGYAYDGVWATALAIEDVVKKLHKQEQAYSSISEFRYRDPFWGELFLDSLANVHFEGVTGLVRFIDNDRDGHIAVKQIQGGRVRSVAEYEKKFDAMDYYISWPIQFKGSSPPVDRTRIVIEQTRISLIAYSILAVISACGIVMAVVFLGINIKNRHNRFIKMSSPYLNNVIIVGCILTYTSVILLGLDSNLTSVDSLPYVCTVRAWVLMAGFTLAFGSMFSKTWRVHAIFTNIKLHKKAITDSQLFVVVAILVAIDIVIMTAWQVIDPFFRETREMKSLARHSDDGILVIPQMEYCISHWMTTFMGVIYVYKGLLMIVGIFLAWETRHVSVPALNDSKYIGMCVYNLVITCTIGAAISHVLSEQQNTSFIIISIFIIFCATTTLCLVFVPKIVELKRNPYGDNKTRFALQPPVRPVLPVTNNVVPKAGEHFKSLREENQFYRKTLRDVDLELKSLMLQLSNGSRQNLFDQEHSKFPRIEEILAQQPSPTLSRCDGESVNSLTDSQDDQSENLPFALKSFSALNIIENPLVLVAGIVAMEAANANTEDDDQSEQPRNNQTASRNNHNQRSNNQDHRKSSWRSCQTSSVDATNSNEPNLNPGRM